MPDYGFPRSSSPACVGSLLSRASPPCCISSDRAPTHNRMSFLLSSKLAPLKQRNRHDSDMDWWLRLRPRVRWAVGLATCLVVGVAVFYFVPGMPDSPHGHQTRDLGRSIVEALATTVTAGLMLRFVVLRS